MWYRGIKKRKSNNNKNKNPECNTYTFICITVTCHRSNIPKILYGNTPLQTIQVNKEENKKASSNSYMWVITTGKLEKMQGVIFKYSSSRSSEVVKELLKGYKNILVTDGYAGYNILDEEVTHAECWAHARRKFYDSIPLVNRQMDKTSAVYYSFIETAKLNKLNIYKYINYLLETLPQLEGEQKDTDIEKYLPWSEELPDEIRNYEEEYTELNLE